MSSGVGMQRSTYDTGKATRAAAANSIECPTNCDLFLFYTYVEIPPQVTLGEAMSRDGGSSGEHVGSGRTEIETQDAPLVVNSESGKGSDIEVPTSQDDEGKRRSRAEQAAETSGNGDGSQTAHSDFGNDDEQPEEGGTEGEEEQQYSEFEDANVSARVKPVGVPGPLSRHCYMNFNLIASPQWSLHQWCLEV